MATKRHDQGFLVARKDRCARDLRHHHTAGLNILAATSGRRCSSAWTVFWNVNLLSSIIRLHPGRSPNRGC